MNDQRLDRIESHLSQLIQMVAENNRIVQDLKQDVSGLKQDVSGLKQDVSGLKQDVSGLKQDVSGLKQDFKGLEQRFEEEQQLNRQRHAEVMKEIRNQSFEIEYVRTQVSKHDMDIYKLNQQLAHQP